MEPQDSSTQPMMCPGDWHELIAAAHEAGLCAAHELARRCSLRDLGRPGRVWIHIEPEPANSPVAGSFLHQGQAQIAPDDSGALLPVELAAPDLYPTSNPDAKAESVLVRRAYAATYCTVLAEEAGASAELDVTPIVPPQPRSNVSAPAAVSSETPPPPTEDLSL